MRCARARRIVAEQQWGFVDPTVGRAAARHLDACPPCAAVARAEARLTAGLAALGDHEAPQLDVVAAVMARIADSERVERRDVPTRELGWAAGGAVAAGLVLVSMLFWMLPDLGRLLGEVRLLAGAIREALVPLATPALVLLEIPARLLSLVGSGLASLLIALRLVLDGLRPVAVGALGVGWVAMALTIMLVVGREWVRPGLAWNRKES